MGLGVWDAKFGVWGLGFGGFGFWVLGFWFLVLGLEFLVWGFWYLFSGFKGYLFSDAGSRVYRVGVQGPGNTFHEPNLNLQP